MQKFLIAYTTNSGTTLDVANVIADELAKNEFRVDVIRLEEINDLTPYSMVVVGGPMIMGWHKAAVRFIKQNQQFLSQVPVAYFITAMRLTETGDTSVDGVPISLDPNLVKPPKKEGHPGFKERYASPFKYLHPVLNAARAVKPRNVAFFGGKLELYRLKWWQALFVLIVIQAQPGGSHNESFIREWAANLSLSITGKGTA